MLLGAQGSNDKGIQVLKEVSKYLKVSVSLTSFEKQQVRNVPMCTIAPMCTIQRWYLSPKNSELQLSKMGNFGTGHLYFNCCIKNKTEQNKMIKSSKTDEIVYIFSNAIAANSPNNHVLQLYCIFTEYTNLGKLETYRGLQSRANFKDHEEHKDKTGHVPRGLVQLCSACLQG